MSGQNKRLDEEVQIEQPQEYMSTTEAAEYLRVSKAFLDERRYLGADGPPFLRLGGRRIVYRKVDIDRWAARCRVDPGQYGEE